MTNQDPFLVPALNKVFIFFCGPGILGANLATLNVPGLSFGKF